MQELKKNCVGAEHFSTMIVTNFISWSIKPRIPEKSNPESGCEIFLRNICIHLQYYAIVAT
jgi:hypothetical protein